MIVKLETGKKLIDNYDNRNEYLIVGILDNIVALEKWWSYEIIWMSRKHLITEIEKGKYNLLEANEYIL